MPTNAGSNTTGILLVGGTGSRLFPLTKAVNKHLLPIHYKPMVFYPLSTLLLFGVNRVICVGSADTQGQFEALMSPLSEMGVDFKYVVQAHPLGISDAMHSAMKYVETERVLVILGDNIFFGAQFVRSSFQKIKRNKRCNIFSIEIKNSQNFGVVQRDDCGNIVELIEKPENFVSNEVITGLYEFETTFLNSILGEKAKSERGEYEIVPLLQIAHNMHVLNAITIDRGVFWGDAGSFQDYIQIVDYITSYENRTGRLVNSPEEICLRNGWVSIEKYRSVIEKYPDGHYRDYLLGIPKGQRQ